MTLIDRSRLAINLRLTEADIAPHRVARAYLMPLDETPLQKQICEHLNLFRWCEAHIIGQMKRGKYNSGMRSRKHPDGAVDIDVTVQHKVTGIGVHVCLEVKHPKDPMRRDKRLEGQETYVADQERVGAFGGFVACPEEAEAICRAVRHWSVPVVVALQQEVAELRKRLGESESNERRVT